MAGINEQTGYDAVASIGKVTAPENTSAELEKGANRINYMSKDRMYEGGTGIADIVKEAQPQDLYQNPVKAMTQNPNKEMYANLLDYKFMN